MARTGYGHTVLDHYVERVRSMRAERSRRLQSVTTRRLARAYQDEVRQAIRRAFAPLPQRTPLEARVTGVVEQSRHRVEKVLFESRPGCLVTAHLYVPAGLERPSPAVLGTCGHSATGKLEPLYQAFCQRLARAGFVVLILDPLNQGERDQYWGLDERGDMDSCCHAHNMMGKQLELVGEWFGAWRAWDGIRALDYLLGRPEVDPARVGVTGNSGGGTMTTWLWPLDERLTMAAPSCFVTTFLANLENELPADCEQYPPGVLGAGLEMADFLIARAPDPVLMLGQTYDFFDRRGLREAYAEVRRFYDVLGAGEDRARLFIGPQSHGFSVHNQEAMVSFFAAHAGAGRAPRLRAPVALEPAEGNVTPRGNTVAAGATPVHALIACRAAELRAARSGARSRSALAGALAALLHLPERCGVPHYRVLRAGRVGDTACARFAVETEGPVRALLYRRVPVPGRTHTLDVEREVHLYLPHVACQTDLAEDPLAAGLLRQHPLFALDVRGLGESLPDGDEPFFHAYGMDYMHHGHALLLGESYLGRRVHDVLSTLDLLAAAGARRVRLYGRGQGALLALFAAVLDRRVAHVTLKNGPLSYQAWAEVPLVAWPAARWLSRVLAHFDLPDLLRALGRRVRLVEPWGPDMRPLEPEALRRALAAAGLPAPVAAPEP